MCCHSYHWDNFKGCEALANISKSSVLNDSWHAQKNNHNQPHLEKFDRINVSNLPNKTVRKEKNP